MSLAPAAGITLEAQLQEKTVRPGKETDFAWLLICSAPRVADWVGICWSLETDIIGNCWQPDSSLAEAAQRWVAEH